MGSKFGNFLRDRRKNGLGLSLKDVGGGSFSSQSLSNYERGLSLPPQDALPTLAECYQVNEKTITDIYSVSLGEMLSGPIAAPPFFDSLKSARRGDHVVTITQTSIFVETPRYVKDVLINFLNVGANFTYVAYLPRSNSSQRYSGWADNHDEGARVIQRELGREPSPENRGRGRVNFLLIGHPDENDFLYLKGYGACNYLCREQSDEFFESEMWLETKAPDGRHSWSACDYGLLSETHDWLSNRCGLALPGNSLKDDRIADRDGRQVRMLSLEEFIESQ